MTHLLFVWILAPASFIWYPIEKILNSLWHPHASHDPIGPLQHHNGASLPVARARAISTFDPHLCEAQG